MDGQKFKNKTQIYSYKTKEIKEFSDFFIYWSKKFWIVFANFL